MDSVISGLFVLLPSLIIVCLGGTLLSLPLFKDMIPLGSPGFHKTHYIDQVNLKLSDLLLSAGRVLPLPLLLS